MKFNLKILLIVAVFNLVNYLSIYSAELKEKVESEISSQQQLDEALYIAISDPNISEDEREQEVANLISKGANANVVYSNNENPSLLKGNGWNTYGVTPLTLALKRCPFALKSFGSNLRRLNNWGQTIFDNNLSGSSPLNKSSTINIILRMLIEAGVNVNFKNKFGVPTIFYASDNPKALEILIDAGADVNDTLNSQTMLIYSVKEAYGHYKQSLGNLYEHFYAPKAAMYRRIIEKLLNKEADLNIRDNDGKTAFDYAKNDPGVLKMLNDAKLMRDSQIKDALNLLLIPDLTSIVCGY